MLILNISTDYFTRNLVTYTSDKIPVIPKFPFPKHPPQRRVLLEYLPSRYTLENLNDLRRGIPWRCRDKKMNMIFHNLHDFYFKIILFCNRPKYRLRGSGKLFRKYRFPIFRYPYDMVLQVIDGMMGSFDCAHSQSI